VLASSKLQAGKPVLASWCQVIADYDFAWERLRERTRRSLAPFFACAGVELLAAANLCLVTFEKGDGVVAVREAKQILRRCALGSFAW